MTLESSLRQLEGLTDLIAISKKYDERARSGNTNRAYRSDWADFEKWCKNKGLCALPAQPITIKLYLTDRASKLKVSSLSRRLTAIREAHKLAKHPLNTKDPDITETWKGIRNELGTAQSAKSPILISDIRELVKTLPDTLTGTRDRAILLIGFAGAFRRSEIVGIDFKDLSFEREGLKIKIRKSKTDQEAEGRDVGVPYGSNSNTCPIRSLQDWLSISGIIEGSIFRGIDKHGRIRKERLSDKSVALIVKRYAYLREITNGKKPKDAEIAIEKFSGHSLRAGFVTTAAKAGVHENNIMRVTGHKKSDMLRKYIRHGTVFEDMAASKIGL